MPRTHGGGRDKKDTHTPPSELKRLQIQSHAQDKTTQHPVAAITNLWLEFPLVLPEQTNLDRPFRSTEQQKTSTVVSTVDTKYIAEHSRHWNADLTPLIGEEFLFSLLQLLEAYSFSKGFGKCPDPAAWLSVFPTQQRCFGGKDSETALRSSSSHLVLKDAAQLGALATLLKGIL